MKVAEVSEPLTLLVFKSLDGGTDSAVQKRVQSVAEQVVLSQSSVDETTINLTEVIWTLCITGVHIGNWMPPVFKSFSCIVA